MIKIVIKAPIVWFGNDDGLIEQLAEALKPVLGSELEIRVQEEDLIEEMNNGGYFA